MSSSEKETQAEKDAKEQAANIEITPAEEQKPTPPKREPKPVTISDIELENLKKELAETKDKYLRALADSENARKRLQKEKQEMIQYALKGLLIDFLNPIDHMENALKFTQHMSEEIKHWGIGFQMILAQFKDVLAANGVTPFESMGQPFDPSRHEAIESIATNDFPPDVVIEESLRGYTIKGDILRVARVKVSKAPKTSANTQPEESINSDAGNIQE